MSAVVRDLLAKGLDRSTAPNQDKRRRRFLSAGAGRARQGEAAPVSEQHDAALAKVLRS